MPAPWCGESLSGESGWPRDRSIPQGGAVMSVFTIVPHVQTEAAKQGCYEGGAAPPHAGHEELLDSRLPVAGGAICMSALK